MSRNLVAALLVLFYFAWWVYVRVSYPLYGLVGAAEEGLAGYVISGVVPWAVWIARGSRAANAKSLFIPWAILSVILAALMFYLRHASN